MMGTLNAGSHVRQSHVRLCSSKTQALQLASSGEPQLVNDSEIGQGLP